MAWMYGNDDNEFGREINYLSSSTTNYSMRLGQYLPSQRFSLDNSSSREFITKKTDRS